MADPHDLVARQRDPGLAPRFVIGQRVALRVNRSRKGVIVGVLASRGTASRYRVFHGPGEREYDEDQLVAGERVSRRSMRPTGGSNGHWRPTRQHWIQTMCSARATPQFVRSLQSARSRDFPTTRCGSGYRRLRSFLRRPGRVTSVVRRKRSKRSRVEIAPWRSNVTALAARGRAPSLPRLAMGALAMAVGAAVHAGGRRSAPRRDKVTHW